jgi:zinc/manganese transport system substrate-binding protein
MQGRAQWHRAAVRVGVPAAVVAASLMLLTGCGSAGEDAASDSSSNGRIAVLASTNVYGDIAAEVGGDRVQVTSIINDPNQDPHSYEVSPQNQLALSKARIIIENGGGYDDFIDTMRHSATRADASLLNAVAISGHRPPPGGELNEHVWYDLTAMRMLAARLADVLAQADPSSAASFRANAAGFAAKVAALESGQRAIKAARSGTGIAVTEPVPLYLLDACGLVDRTPAVFSRATEEGTDVPPRVLRQMLNLFTDHQVSLLAYNEQTASSETEKVLAAAKDSHVPVVPVTETLPSGAHYVGWMAGNIAAVQAALSQ